MCTVYRLKVIIQIIVLSSQIRHCHWTLLWCFTPRKLTWQWKINHLQMYFRLKKEIFHCHVSFRGRNIILWKNTQYEPPQNKFKSNIKIVQTYNSYLVRLLSQVPCFFAPNIWCFLSRGSQDTTLSLLFLRSQMKDLKHCLTDVSLDEDFGTSRMKFPVALPKTVTTPWN